MKYVALILPRNNYLCLFKAADLISSRNVMVKLYSWTFFFLKDKWHFQLKLRRENIFFLNKSNLIVIPIST